MSGWRNYFPIIRQRVRARQFRSLFLFVTSRCNSLCRTCFYFDKLNSKDDLSFNEILRMSRTAPPFEKLWISGGEPFLRDELAEIVTRFVRDNGVNSVNLPTNGLLPGKIFPVLDRVLEACPDVEIDLNFSLDGLANTHDAIRGVPNNFEKTLETVAEADRRYKNVRRLRRNVVTVITSENYREIVSLSQHMLREGNVNGHYFEAMRGEVPDPSLKALSRDELTTLHHALMPVHRRYAEQLFERLPAPARAFATMYYLGNVRLHFDLHERCFERPSRWPMPCTAGETSIVVDHNGAFRACELRGVVGQLADYDHDITRALASRAMRQEVAAIPGANCWCTHSCFIHDSSRFSPRVQLFAIPWAYWKQRLAGGGVMRGDEMDRFKTLEVG